MSNFRDAPLGELLKSTEPSTEERHKSFKETMRQIYLAEISDMRDFSRPEDHIVWPRPVRPRWKN